MTTVVSGASQFLQFIYLMRLKLGLYSTLLRAVTDANQSCAIAMQRKSYVRWQISTPSVVSCICILTLQSRIYLRHYVACMPKYIKLLYLWGLEAQAKPPKTQVLST